MFSFFKKKIPPADGPETVPQPGDAFTSASPGDGHETPALDADPERRTWLDRLRGTAPAPAPPPASAPVRVPVPVPVPVPAPAPAPAPPVAPVAPTFPPRDATAVAVPPPAPAAPPVARPTAAPVSAAPWPPAPAAARDEIPAPPTQPAQPKPVSRWAWALPGFAAGSVESVAAAPGPEAEREAEPAPEDRRGWVDKLRGGLRKTGTSIAQVFVGTNIDEALYEELEAALLMADAGVRATEFLLADLRRRVKDARATDPTLVKGLLADGITELLAPLQKPLVIGEHQPTVIMVVGVNGAGKTTTIGKLTRHLADARKKVLLAAADTFRAAAREQLAVWAERADGQRSAAATPVEIVSQQDGDPAAVTFDAVVAGKARGCDVVIADTAGRLATQTHLMEELKKVRRVIAKAQAGAPHEVLLVVDGNTGQNALTQVQAFDAALQLTGLIVTKLDGTAKGGVLAAVALWSRERARGPGGSVLPVYFVGVGEKLEDLQTFDAREFAQALLA
jgi:fused signal recognition particle receptor